MNPALYLLPFLIITVPLLIYAELRGARRQIFIFKPLSTLLVIAAAVLAFWQPAHNATYTIGVLVGLLFSLGGDVALMFQDNPKAFTIGLGLFLTAHIAYSVTFIRLGQFAASDLFTAAVLVVVAAAFYRLIASNLGKMKLPVIVYMLVISLMVDRAVAAFNSPAFSHAQAWMIPTGAVLFYLSDMILAANRFWKPWKYQRISLAFYYAGQFLIALAASYFV